MAVEVVIGAKALHLKFRTVASRTKVATAFGTYEGLQEIMLDAKERAPKDTTTMARSGYVTPPAVGNRADASVEAGFGGNASEYVARVHEDLEMVHPNGGEARFFANALDAGRGALLATIKKHVRDYIDTGRTTPVPKKVPATPWEG